MLTQLHRQATSWKFLAIHNENQDEIPTIVKNCNEKQKQLKEERLQTKKITNVALDKRRNKDLEELKKKGQAICNCRRSQSTDGRCKHKQRSRNEFIEKSDMLAILPSPSQNQETFFAS